MVRKIVQENFYGQNYDFHIFLKNITLDLQAMLKGCNNSRYYTGSRLGLPQITSTPFSILLAQFAIFYSSSVRCREVSQQCTTESFSELGNMIKTKIRGKLLKTFLLSSHNLLTIECRLPFCAYYKKPHNGVIVK